MGKRSRFPANVTTIFPLPIIQIHQIDPLVSLSSLTHVHGRVIIKIGRCCLGSGVLRNRGSISIISNYELWIIRLNRSGNCLWNSPHHLYLCLIASSFCASIKTWKTRKGGGGGTNGSFARNDSFEGVDGKRRKKRRRRGRGEGGTTSRVDLLT